MVTDGDLHRNVAPRQNPPSTACDEVDAGQVAWDLALLVDLSSGSGEGRFRRSGVNEDAGPASHRFVAADDVIEGVVELESRVPSGPGRLRLEVTYTATFNSALAAGIEGSFTIVDGDGAYAGTVGTGRICGRLTYDQSKQGFMLNATCRVLT